MSALLLLQALVANLEEEAWLCLAYSSSWEEGSSNSHNLQSLLLSPRPVSLGQAVAGPRKGLPSYNLIYCVCSGIVSQGPWKTGFGGVDAEGS